MVGVSRRLNLLENPFRISVKRNKNVEHQGAIQSSKKGFCAHKTTCNNRAILLQKEPIWHGNSILEYNQSFFFFTALYYEVEKESVCLPGQFLWSLKGYPWLSINFNYLKTSTTTPGSFFKIEHQYH